MPESIKENFLICILYQMDGNTSLTLAPYFSKVISSRYTFKYGDVIFVYLIHYRYYQYYFNSYHLNKFMF